MKSVLTLFLETPPASPALSCWCHNLLSFQRASCLKMRRSRSPVRGRQWCCDLRTRFRGSEPSMTFWAACSIRVASSKACSKSPVHAPNRMKLWHASAITLGMTSISGALTEITSTGSPVDRQIRSHSPPEVKMVPSNLQVRSRSIDASPATLVATGDAAGAAGADARSSLSEGIS